MFSALNRLSSRGLSEEALAAATQTTSYSTVSTLSFLIWDTIIHFSDELEFIWLGPNSWVKFMYLFIRYVPILAQSSLIPIETATTTGVYFSEQTCRDWLIFQGVSVQAVITAVEIVLVVRVNALYNNRKEVFWGLTLLLTIELAIMIASAAISGPRARFNSQCHTTSESSIFLAYWLSSLVFETILFGMTLIKSFSFVRRGLNKRSITYIFLRDSTWAFALIFVIMLLNTLMYSLIHSPLSGISYFWSLSVISFAGAHVLLNLRRFILQPDDLTFDSRFGTHLTFAARERRPPEVGTDVESTTEFPDNSMIPMSDMNI